ncbi:glycosyltransferase [Natrialbaceae archaeon A-CW1-1]
MTKKVAIFLSSFEGGGAHKNMIHISNYLNSSGYNVDLVVVNNKGDLRNLVSNEVDIVSLGTSRVRYSVSSLLNYIRRSRPDSLLATPTGCTIVAGIVDILPIYNIPITLRVPTTLSESRLYNKPNDIVEKQFSKVIEHIYKRSKSIIAISEGVKIDLVNEFGIPNNKVKIIHNPVVTDDVIKKIHEPVDHPFFNDSSQIFIGVGRLTEQKGFKYLIDAFSIVEKEVDAKLIILGQGELDRELKKRCEELSITNKVSFPGFVHNPFKYIHNSDVFVLSSLWEGFGNVVVEALACKTAVVATDCRSGPSEILADGEFGRLVPPAAPSKLADGMLESLSHNHDSTKLRHRALDFHVKNIGPEYEQELII